MRPRMNSLVRRLAPRLGFDAVAADHYSPIVRADSLPPEVWDRIDPMPGLELDLDAQLQRLEELSGWFQELERSGFPVANGWYGPLDAHVLYALLRSRPPRRVVELGSGYSTRLIELAAPEAEHHVIDPFPSARMGEAGRRVHLHRVSGADAPGHLFASLADGDVLFIDSSHVVKPGGEVVRIVLQVLPSLGAGVLVHFHDIFRPFAYPRVFPETLNLHWQEQYLVEAFLSFNAHFEVLSANHALWRMRRERVRELVPGLREGMEPSGFWLRRR